MKIRILGTKGEIEPSLPYHSKQSGILIDDSILFDIGEKQFLKYAPKAIVITHFHPDHAYFIRKGCEEVPSTNAEIYAPEKPLNEQIASKIQIIDRSKKIQSYRITPIPTHHSKYVKSVAYLIKKAGKSVLYTSDLIWINKEYHHLFKKVDLVITEGSFIRKGGMIRRDKKNGEIYGHNGIPDLIRLFKNYTSQILLVHFGQWFYQNTKEARKKLNALGKENGVRVLIGYDGMELQL